MLIYKKQEIIVELKIKVDNFNSYIATLDKRKFEVTPDGKWSAGQNLEHLIRSMKPLKYAYGLPKFMLRLLFGKANRPSRSYDELVAKYKRKLKEGGRASRAYIPPVIDFDRKEKMIRNYQQQASRLIKIIRLHKEAELDKYILPHPLLGKLTLREMLFFTIHHNEHHLSLLLKREE